MSILYSLGSLIAICGAIYYNKDLDTARYNVIIGVIFLILADTSLIKKHFKIK